MNNILIFLFGLLKTNQVVPEHPTDDHRDSPLFFFLIPEQQLFILLTKNNQEESAKTNPNQKTNPTKTRKP